MLGVMVGLDPSLTSTMAGACRSARTWHADIISWLLVSGTHLFDVVLERLPEMFPYSALVGLTVDTRLRQSTVFFLHFSVMLGSTVDINLRQSTVLFVFRAMLGSSVDTDCVRLRSSFVFQRNAWFDSGYILSRSSSCWQWHGCCWFAGNDAFALCSLRRRQARGVSTGAVAATVPAACFASWDEG